MTTRFFSAVSKKILSVVFLGSSLGFVSPSYSFTVLGTSDAFIGSGFTNTDGYAWRWDAGDRMVSGLDRSIGNGLDYSLEGGSFTAFRDSFSWLGGVPLEADFTSVVRNSFAAWEVPDPSTNLVSSVRFNERLDIVATVAGDSGAEIDLMATDLSGTFGGGVTGGTGGMSVSASGFGNTLISTVDLTSGVADYSQAFSVGGIVNMNNDPTSLWTLNTFQAILTHEIGHALGLGDVELNSGSSPFYDDNFDGSSTATVVDTLTNPWSGLIDPLDPENDPDVVGYTISGATFDQGSGDAPNLVMETNNDLQLSLTADEFAARQFLYPSLVFVPEPSSLVFLGMGVLLSLRRRRF